MTSDEEHPAADTGEVSQLLHQWAAGDRAALDALIPKVYDELRRLAGGYLRHERADHTLQATALVHEAFFRLAGQERVAWQNRGHFFAIAAQAMRRILVDHARRLAAARRIGPESRLPVELAADLTVDEGEGLLEVHLALERLAELSERQARIVELRFFGGLTVAQTAEVLELSVPTVVRDWAVSRRRPEPTSRPWSCGASGARLRRWSTLRASDFWPGSIWRATSWSKPRPQTGRHGR